MTIWFVTSGTSLMRSRCWAVEDPSKTSEEVTRWLADLPDPREEPRDGLEAGARDLVAAHLTPDGICTERSRSLPAEVATLVHLRPEFREGDRVVVAHGTGQQELVAHVLRELILLLVGSIGVSVELSGPYEWDPTSTDAFNHAMDQLWTDAKGLWDHAEMRFVFTGGYKAIGMCLAARISKSARTTHVYYVHEGPSALVEIRFGEDGSAIAVRSGPGCY